MPPTLFRTLRTLGTQSGIAGTARRFKGPGPLYTRWISYRYPAGVPGFGARASVVRLSSRFDQGCAAKTWATAPPLKAVVLIGSMVSGAVKSCSPEPRTTGWMTRRYSSIKPDLTSDREPRTALSEQVLAGVLLLEAA